MEYWVDQGEDQAWEGGWGGSRVCHQILCPPNLHPKAKYCFLPGVYWAQIQIDPLLPAELKGTLSASLDLQNTVVAISSL